jgi:SAM-dependent methyltransferase
VMGETAKHSYEDKFFDYIEIGARRSAQHIIGFLHRYLAVTSVLDVGCGRGVWVEEWRRRGVADVLGTDGGYVRTDRLVIPQEQFVAFDLSRVFRLDRRFDLVQSLEVAEHIPVSQADVFIDNLVAHSDVILFSAAVPGQGGEFHVNEQPYEYWRSKFANRSFAMFDFLRPNIMKNHAIEPWYRYNTFLFVHESALSRIPESVLQTQIGQSERVADLAPLSWLLRNLTFRYLPQPLVQRIARLKHAMVRAGLRPK